MVISQPPGNNPSYYYHCFCLLPQFALNASRDTLYFLYVRITTSEQLFRNGAIKHIFTQDQIHGGSSADYSLFILSLHALALHLLG